MNKINVFIVMNKIPYAHAFAVIARIKENSYSYCSKYYTTEMYIQTYSGTIFLVGNYNDQTIPNKVKTKIVLAPDPKRNFGSPREKKYHKKEKRKSKVQYMEDVGRLATIENHAKIQQH